MRNSKTRALSLLLAGSMVLPMVPPALAVNESGGTSYFDFEATEYDVKESGSLEIKIVRHGAGDAPAEVLMKVADFLSSYGDDYVVLTDGGELEKVFGEKPSYADFVYEEEDASDADRAPADEGRNDADGNEEPAGEDEEFSDDGEKGDEPFGTSKDEVPADEDTEDSDVNEEAADREIADETEESADEAEEPAGETEESVGEAEEPVDETEESVGETEESVGETEEPVGEAEEPVDETEEPAGEDGVFSDEDSSRADEDEEPAAQKAPSAKANPDSSVADPVKSGAVLDTVTGKGTTTGGTVSRYHTGSSLLDAAYQYLNLEQPAAEEKVAAENGVGDTLTEVYGYFEKAEGAQGVVSFGRGETEKTITIKPIDNDQPDGSRIFMIALMATDSDETSVAPNATTYVSILDDEEHEDAVFELDADGVVLTQSRPTAEVTIRRTAGTQYFSFAYLSTVSGTAAAGAYDSMADKPVAFVLGETEKTVTLRAADFSSSGMFGLRLDDENGKMNGYAEIELRGSDAAAAETRGINNRQLVPDSALPETEQATESAPASADDIAPQAEDEDVSLFASNVTLGWKYSTLDGQVGNSVINSAGLESQWKSVITGGDKGNYVKFVKRDGSNVLEDIVVRNENKKKYTMAVTKNSYNLTGVHNLVFWVKNDGKGSNYWTYLDVDDDQTYEGHCGDLWERKGRFEIMEPSLDVGDQNENRYIKFSVTPRSNGDKHQPCAQLGHLDFEWTRYDFSPESSAKAFNRYIYDFTLGTPKRVATYYDGQTSRIYRPGPVTVKYNNNTVSGFYGNANQSVTIEPANGTEIANNGFYLAGVYFASNSKDYSNIYDSRTNTYSSNGTYYVAAGKDHKVTVALNQAFVKTLMNKGVVPSKCGDSANIKIFPVYEQETVQVNFENTDRNDSVASSKGKYDENHLASHFANIIEAWQSGGKKTSWNTDEKVFKWKHGSWLDVYSIIVPKNSIIRLKVQPASTRTPSGIRWWPWECNSNVVYDKKGSKRYSSDVPGGVTIEETDQAVGEFVANTNIACAPATGQQSFYVGYAPQLLNGALDKFKSLQNAVTSGDPLDPNAQTTDKNGSMWLKNPSIGQKYTLNAIAPEGYYVSWANMSGDVNNNGVIGDDESVPKRADRSSSANPTYVYGNQLHLTLDTDHTRYYYMFQKAEGEVNITKSGTVLREKNTFYRLANGLGSLKNEPVAAAYVNVAGYTGQTGLDGSYSIPLTGLPAWGGISTTVMADGQSYSGLTSIENGMDKTILPALDRFTARSTSAKYAKAENSKRVNNSVVTVVDDTLTIQAKVMANGALIPAGAKFSIYSSEGIKKADCVGTGYKTSFDSSGNVYTATLSFNPKSILDPGDTVHIQFCDQNNTYYHDIDLGYNFFTPLTLDKFILPAIGSSTLEDIATGDNIVTDIIGNPLGDLNVGSIKLNGGDGYDYAPSSRLSNGTSLEDLAADQKWTRTDYTAGWSKEFEAVDEDYDSEEKYAEKMKEYLEKVKKGDTSAVRPENSGYATKGSFNWKLTPEVGFKMTLSTRGDKKNQKTYFEDLVFYLRVSTTVEAEGEIQLPIGMSIVVGFDLEGDAVGIFRMYNDYQDPYEIEDATLYDAENFGLFKKFNNSIRREGYIFLNPTIGVSVDVKVAILSVGAKATFAFDMDFRFAGTGSYTWGDMDVQLDWRIKLIGFQVYSKRLTDQKIHLFNSDNQDGPIDLDYAVSTAMLAMDEAVGSTLGTDDDGFSLDTPVPRDYLKYRSDWNGGGVSLLGDASSGTAETVLRSGTADNPDMSITPINNNGDMLMVFIDDDTSRSNVNKRALFYSVCTGGVWSEPQQVDNDGTLDDSPNVFDLGDDRILVTWSSADEVLEEGAKVTDALHMLNLKAAFFSKSGKRFGAAEQLTKNTNPEGEPITGNTSGDFGADVLSRAAYDPVSKKILLFYTKTEYTHADEGYTNFNKAESVISYLFYEDGKGWQNTKDAYTDAEKTALGETYINAFYGQRFLDSRIGGGDLLCVVDTAAISYNQLGLFAWVVDWDDDLETLNDRDVFMQIYDFQAGTFTHVIRVTEKTGTYAAPQFARSDNATYLFYGAREKDSEYGEIRYLDISHAIKNRLYTEHEDSGISYYDLKYTQNPNVDDDGNPVIFENSSGETITLPVEEYWVNTDTAAACYNIHDYRVTVADNGQMYLFWTESKGSSCEVMAALYNGEDDDEESAVDSGDDTEQLWSEPFQLTSGTNVYYSGIGATVSGGNLYVGGVRGSYTEEGRTDLVMLTHTPFAGVELAGVSVAEEYPQPGGSVTVTAVITNAGMLTFNGTVPVTFTVNGGSSVTAEYTGAIPGAGSVEISASLPVPEDHSELVLEASYGGTNKSVTIVPESVLEVLESSVQSRVSGIEEQADDNVYTGSAANTGSAPTGEITVQIASGSTVLAEQTLPSLMPGESMEIEIPFDASDVPLTLNGSVGNAPVQVTFCCDGKTVFVYDGQIGKSYDADAMELLKGASVSSTVSFSMEENENRSLQPTISGPNADQLQVLWLESSNGDIAEIDFSNVIFSGKSGTATLTGILVPKGFVYRASADGSEMTEMDWRDRIPASMLQTVTAALTVGAGSSSDNSGNSGSGESSQPSSDNSDSSGSSHPSSDYSRPPMKTDKAQDQDSKTPAEDDSPDTSANAPTETPTSENNFADVTQDAYYFQAVQWATANGVTAGTGPNRFSPEQPCTRAQIVTFLWRASQSPEPTIDVNPFTDTEAGAYYAQAMLWAVEQGITAGISESLFGPEQPCTRAQAVTFLYRLAGMPETEISTVFVDVPEGEYYAKAVSWAVQNGITSGTSATTFSPNAVCERGQIVTFLHRYFMQQ